jgi:hypothetical protein
MVGVIPCMSKCGRDASLGVEQRLNYPQLANSKDYPEIDGYSSVPFGRNTHLSEDNWGAIRSSGTKRLSSLAHPSLRPARNAPMRATGLTERLRSAAIEPAIEI